MALLVTGATGFVMSVMARHWLDLHPRNRVVVLDRAGFDAASQAYLAPVRDRLTLVQADVTRPETWSRALDGLDIVQVVHGATVTPISRGSAAEARREPEADDPARILEVNLMGTVHMLDWARRQAGFKRFIYVSSGAVYSKDGPQRPGDPLPEEGFVAPRKLYGISKQAAELVVERYAGLFGFEAASVRLSSVYGTMDRVTASRDFRHVPNRIAHWALRRGEPLRVNTFDAVGDYIHAEDVARGIAALLAAPRLRYAVYNVAQGETAAIGDIVGWAAAKVPDFRAEIAPASEADIVEDASLSAGMWGAYDISRIVAETGWHPRPTREAFLAYMDWIVATGTLHGGRAAEDLFGPPP